VGAHAAPLVVETCGGLLVGAVAERMGGFGRLCAAHTGKNCPTLDILRLMNLGDAERGVVVTAPLTELLRARAAGAEAAALAAAAGGGGEASAAGGEAGAAVADVEIQAEKEVAEEEEGQDAPAVEEAAAGGGTGGGGSGSDTHGRGAWKGDESKMRERPEGWVSKRLIAATPEDIDGLVACPVGAYSRPLFGST
jgi:tRNA (adenine-N(1)-)-methyltransferase non-catalytic subunit